MRFDSSFVNEDSTRYVNSLVNQCFQKAVNILRSMSTTEVVVFGLNYRLVKQPLEPENNMKVGTGRLPIWETTAVHRWRHDLV